MENLFRGIFILIIIAFSPKFLFSQAIKEIKATQLTYLRYLGETLTWKLKTEEFFKKGEDYFEAKNIYLENLPKGIKIVAEKGRYLPKEEKFILTGRVKLLKDKEGEVYTEELNFFPKRNLIEVPGAVIIRKESVEIRGEGLSYYVSQGNFKIHRKVRVKFRF